MKILLTGGSGLLGQELLKCDPKILAPNRDEMDILNSLQCEQVIDKYNPDTILHAAAFTSPPKCDSEPEKARNNNITGTVNLVNICQKRNKRLIYISTDYAFDGEKGMYNTDDLVNPINIYAISKVAGEFAVKTYLNSLIIRTSFGPVDFPYEKAFTDQYTSKDYVDIIAPKILQFSRSSKTGIAHVGTERKTVYDLAKQRKPNVGNLSIKDVAFNAPQDTSLTLTTI